MGYSNCDIHSLIEFDNSYENSYLIKGLKLKTNGEFSSYSKVPYDSEPINRSSSYQKKTVKSSPILQESRKCTARFMFSYVPLPSFTAATTVEKLSSVSIISAFPIGIIMIIMIRSFFLDAKAYICERDLQIQSIKKSIIPILDMRNLVSYQDLKEIDSSIWQIFIVSAKMKNKLLRNIKIFVVNMKI